MNFSGFWIWSAGGEIIVPKLAMQEWAALVMLAVTLLVFRTFRERYLMIWILGWIAYLAAHWTLRGPAQNVPASLTAISQTMFVLAVGLFAVAIAVYTHGRKLLRPIILAGIALCLFAPARALYWPDSLSLRILLEVSYRAFALVAAVQLIRFRWARGQLAPWLFGMSFLWLHLPWEPIDAHVHLSASVFGDLLLAVSLLLLVLDDFKTRMQRLAVINALTTTITKAQQYGPMMSTALEELKGLMRARAAWFRLMEGENMVIVQQIGLSASFLRERTVIAVDRELDSVLKNGVPAVVTTENAGQSVAGFLAAERFDHVVIIPVLGKKAPIGTLTLGSRRRLSYSPEEFEFLSTMAHQLGLAVENLRLVEQIVRSHRQWANTFDSIQDVILVHDGDYRIMRANLALLQRLEQAAADVLGEVCEEVLPHGNQGWIGCPYCHAREAGFHEGPDPCFGGVSMVSTSSYSEQGSNQKGTIHVIRDVTDRHLAEEKYRLLFEQAQEGVFVSTPAGKLIDCNQAFFRMLGYDSREEIMEADLAELYADPDRRDAFRREMEEHSHVRNFEAVLRRKDGNFITAVESSFATRNGSGAIERYQGFLLDVTEKKRAEDEIRRRNRELNALNAMAVIATQSFDLDEILNLTLRQVISLLGAETGSVYLADADEVTFRRRAGWGQRSADRARFAEVTIPDFGELVMRSRTEVITPEFIPHLPSGVADFIRADGFQSWIWVLLWSKDRPIGMMGIGSRASHEYTSNDESLLVAIGRQLATTVEKVRLYEETCRAYDDLRKTQEQLLQSEKMSAVGQLISGVAHELNNPLTAILGYAQRLESEGLQDHAADFVRKLFKQAQRTHRVVQNLLSFARERKPQKQQVDIVKVLDETIALRDYDVKVNDITLERVAEPELPPVTADAHQLEQVFLNIINNAIDAILENGAGQGGRFSIRTFQKDGYVFVSFQDSGSGIKEPKRIFDPFYTTKSVGKGTGLGLSICYGIIKEHGGDIVARNAPEGGAIVEVRLPAANATECVSIPEPQPKREGALEGTLLLIEDEEAVLEFERDVLSGAGARVTALMNIEEISQSLADSKFDALVVNGKMPGGWGAIETYHWLGKTHPGMEHHLLFTFSSVAEPEVREFLQEHNVPHLAKPFEVADLIHQARRIMAKAQAAGA